MKNLLEAVEAIANRMPEGRKEAAEKLLEVLRAGKRQGIAADVLRFLMDVDEAEATGVSFRDEDTEALEQLYNL